MFGPGVGTLPQLEPPVVQVVLSNAKNQQSENILPQIANRGGQNNNQTQVSDWLIDSVIHSFNQSFIHWNRMKCEEECLDTQNMDKKPAVMYSNTVMLMFHYGCLLFRMRGQSPASSSQCVLAQRWIKCPSPGTAKVSVKKQKKTSYAKGRDFPYPL